MEGYVKNISVVPFYIMKRTVVPGESLSADEIKNRYYNESGASTDAKFIEWLKATVFLDTTVWEINLKVSKPRKQKDDNEKVEEEKPKPSSTPHIVKTNPNAKVNELDPNKLLKMSAADCKKFLEECDDTKFLKQLLIKAEKMARKQKTCKVIRDRLGELGVS